MTIGPRDLDLIVAGCSTHSWVGQSGNSDCCTPMSRKPPDGNKVWSDLLTEDEKSLLDDVLNRPMSEAEKRNPHPKAEEARSRPELVPPLISLLLRVYLDAKKRGEEETAEKVVEGLDFLGCLARNPT